MKSSEGKWGRGIYSNLNRVKVLKIEVPWNINAEESNGNIIKNER